MDLKVDSPALICAASLSVGRLGDDGNRQVSHVVDEEVTFFLVHIKPAAASPGKRGSAAW